MPAPTASVLVLSVSPVLRRQIREHLVINNIQFDFVASSAELINTSDSTTKICIVDIGFFKKNLFIEIRALRKALGNKPIFALGSTEKSKIYSVPELHESGINEYFERIDVWSNPNILIERMEIYFSDRPNAKHENTAFSTYKDFAAILIGASTGGPEVLEELLTDFPSKCPPVVLVQHIEVKFSEAFFDKMSEISGLKKGKIAEGETLKSGHLYMATGDFNIGIKKVRGHLALLVDKKKQIGHHRPSVDFLFNSATTLNENFCAILLTGWGADGSRALAALKKRGVYTMVQDKESSPVFGMPEEAIKMGAALFIGNPQEIRKDLFRRL